MIASMRAIPWWSCLCLVWLVGLPAAHADEEASSTEREASESSPEAPSSTSNDSEESEADSTSDTSRAATIVREALKTNSLEFESGRAELVLTIEGNNGDTSTRKMVVKSAEIEGSIRTRIELTAPADVEGQSFLFAENESGSDDVWMYVPAFSVTRRIEGSKKQGSFLGSHFTYNDLESRSLKAANYEMTGESTVGDHKVHVIEATPERGIESAYGKVVAYIRTSDRAPLKFEFFDEDDEKVKQLLVTKLAETESGTTYIKQMRMESTKGGFSEITVASLQEEADLPSSIFSKEQLGE